MVSFAGGVSYFNLSAASHLYFDYLIQLPASVEGRSHLRSILADASHCSDYDRFGQGCSNGGDTEIYYSFHHVLDEESGMHGRIHVELKGDTDPSSSFWRSGWVGIVGNDKIDKDRVKGFT